LSPKYSLVFSYCIILSGVKLNVIVQERKNIVMKTIKKRCPEPLLHLFCCPKIQEQDIELKNINTISGHYDIDSCRRRGWMDEMVLAAPFK
jgi:hypothetical protein